MELEKIKKIDADVAQHIEEELERQQTTIELIASENFTSEAVMAACGTVLTNKYAEGKPHKRYYNGCEVVDKIEELAQKRACEIFGIHMQMYNHTQELKLIWLYLCQCLNVVTKFLVWICQMEDI